jgi:hypothetical protein
MASPLDVQGVIREWRDSVRREVASKNEVLRYNYRTECDNWKQNALVAVAMKQPMPPLPLLKQWKIDEDKLNTWNDRNPGVHDYLMLLDVEHLDPAVLTPPAPVEPSDPVGPPEGGDDPNVFLLASGVRFEAGRRHDKPGFTFIMFGRQTPFGPSGRWRRVPHQL